MTGLKVFVRQADRTTTGQIENWSQITLVQRRNDAGRWTLVLVDPKEAAVLSPPTDSAGNITEPRGVIIRRDGITLASGWCDTTPSIESEGARRTWTFSGFDDTALMSDVTCWPKPASALSAQTDAYDVRTGPRSNRIRDYWIANAGTTRLSIPGAIGGSQVNIGDSGTSRARFDSLLSFAQKIAGKQVNFRVIQRDSDRQLFLQQSAPRDLTLAVQFSPDVGTVKGWSYSATAPTATRVVIGAGGEGTARVFRQYVNTVAEAAWDGRKIERFVDRRDLNPAESTFEAEIAEEGATFLAENDGSSSFSIRIVDAPSCRYGVDFLVGDLVRAFPAPGVPVDDLVEEVTVTWQSSGGESAEVWIGPKEDPEGRDARYDRDLRRRLRRLEGGR